MKKINKDKTLECDVFRYILSFVYRNVGATRFEFCVWSYHDTHTEVLTIRIIRCAQKSTGADATQINILFRICSAK